jgi:hypothetical protein
MTFFFLCSSFFTLLIYFGQEPNEIAFFFICCKIKEKKLDTNKFLRKQEEMKILNGYNLINGAKL